jgi:cobalt-zinc-cadmium efflux system protein
MPGHAHAHGGCDGPDKQTATRLAISLGLNLAFVIVEAGAGWWANSLALLSDAGHNLTDVVALALSWYAVRLSTQPAHAAKTFGYHRAGILVALGNSTTLAVVSLVILYESYARFLAPPAVQSGLLMGVATVAFFINAGAALLVRRGSAHDLSIRTVFVHLLGDAASALGAALAGLVIALTGLNWFDPLASVFISLLILWNAWGILRETVDILLEGTPRDIDMRQMVGDLLNIEGVRGVHDLHVWSVTESLRALSAHVVTDDISLSAGAGIQGQINEIIAHKYGISHATLQLECVGCDPDVLYCNLQEKNHNHGQTPAAGG